MTTLTAPRSGDESATDASAVGRRDEHGGLPRWLVPLVLVLVFVGHLLLSRPMTGVFLSDGNGYLANARWLAGRAGETFQGQTGFYHPGYSLFLAPLFRLFDDPDTIYQGILVVNAALATASVLVYRSLAARLGLRPAPALAAGLVGALYPSVLLQASVEWSENLYHLAFGLLLLAVHRLVHRRDDVAAAAVSVLTVALYSTHPRGLGLIPVAALAFALLGWRRLLPRRAVVVGLGTLVIVFLAARVFHQVLIDAMWADDRPVTEGDVLSRLTDPSLLWGMVKRWFGQGWYLLVASIGLAGAGLARLADDARRPGSTPTAWFARITLLAMAATFAASAVMMSDGTRVDHLVYGRYDEGFLPSLIVIGAAALARWGAPRQLAALGLATGAGIVVLAAATVGLNGGHRFTGQIAPLNVLGVLVWETDRSELDVLRISAGSIAALALLLFARLRSLRAALAIAMVFFLGSTLIVRDRVLVPFTAHWSSLHELPVAVRDIGATGPVAYERAAYRPVPGNYYQFELFDRGVRFWDGTGEPPSDLVISSRAGGRARELGGRLVFVEPSADAALWVLPGPLQDRLVAEGWAFPGRPGDPLPEAARVARLDAPDTVRVEEGEQQVVEVRVTHAGSGSPWAPLAAVEDGTGAVRIRAVWPDGTVAVGDLPHVLPVGESAEVAVVLTTTPPPGRYELRVSALQEGVGPLAGETTFTVLVR